METITTVKAVLATVILLFLTIRLIKRFYLLHTFYKYKKFISKYFNSKYGAASVELESKKIGDFNHYFSALLRKIKNNNTKADFRLFVKYFLVLQLTIEKRFLSTFSTREIDWFTEQIGYTLENKELISQIFPEDKVYDSLIKLMNKRLNSIISDKAELIENMKLQVS